MSYLLVHIIHLGAAAFFIGGVFFEVMILSRAAQQLDAGTRETLSKAVGQRARKVMHWVVLALYGAGFWLGWQYRGVLSNPFASSLGLLMGLKIVLALSILAHFLLVVFLMRSGRMTPQRSRRIHLSVLAHMLLIVFLAKSMFVLQI